MTPKAIININDVDKTGVIKPGSRAEYRLYLTGEKDKLARMYAWLAKEKNAADRLFTSNLNRPGLETAFSSVDFFLKTSVIIALVLSGIAITMAVRSFLRREQDSMALLRCFGMSSLFVFITYA